MTSGTAGTAGEVRPGTTAATTVGHEALFEDSGQPEEYGLALSGGGIRATLFHLGAILRINELGHLRDVDRISGVSGGSLAAGLLARVWDRLEWRDGRATNLERLYSPLVMGLAGLPLDIPIVVLGLLPFVSAANVLALALDRLIFHGMTLQDLPERSEGPRFVFNATDLATGTDFRFSKPYMGSYRVGLVEKPGVTVAVAVAASAAFPPFVSPLILQLDPDKVVKVRGADLHARRELKAKVALTDGGAYDNLALEPIAGRCHVALVSDAGGNLGIEPPGWKWALWSPQVKRTLDIAVSQARSLRRLGLRTDGAAHPYALWRTRTDPEKFARWINLPFVVHAGWPEYLATLPTRLWPFPVQDRQRLVNWGYLTSDLALRSFIWKDAPPPQSLPHPEASFERPPGRVVDVAGEPM